MTSPLITILIRTHRPDMLKKCIESVLNCGYENLNIHIWNGKGLQDNYKYNLLCNDMLESVKGGYLFFLDDDDTLIPGALTEIAPHLDINKPVVCQMKRGDYIKPQINTILRGHIGLPCMIVSWCMATSAQVQDIAAGDYEWIKSITDRYGYTWVPIPLVNSPKRNYGK